MARPRGKAGQDATPSSMPKTTPQEFSQPSHDFTLQAVMEMQRTLGEYAAKIDRLVDDVGKLSGRFGEVEKGVHAVKVGAIVAGTILTVVGGVFWWAIGDRVAAAVRVALSPPPIHAPVLPPAKNP